jgi:hypothetical protein
VSIVENESDGAVGRGSTKFDGGANTSLMSSD